MKIILLYENEPIEERIAEKILAHPAKRAQRVSRRNKKFDAFVSYYERTGKYYAETAKECLEERRIKTFVAHIERPTFSGDFEHVVNAVISRCRFFILLISWGTLERAQVIRETRTAYPEGLKNRPKLFVFRQNNVTRRSKFFMEETRIDIGRENQHDFRDDAELASRILILVDDGEFRV